MPRWSDAISPSASKGDAAKKSDEKYLWLIIQLYGDYFVNRYKDPGRKQPGFNGIQRYQKSNHLRRNKPNGAAVTWRVGWSFGVMFDVVVYLSSNQNPSWFAVFLGGFYYSGDMRIMKHKPWVEDPYESTSLTWIGKVLFVCLFSVIPRTARRTIVTCLEGEGWFFMSVVLRTGYAALMDLKPCLHFCCIKIREGVMGIRKRSRDQDPGHSVFTRGYTTQ